MPTCIAPGHYLMRVEIVALHSASIPGEAQFYMECAQYVSVPALALVPTCLCGHVT